VLGVPGATVTVAVGVLPTVVVAVIPGVTGVVVDVAVTLGVELAVVVGVTAPSSRKSIDGFPHQRSWAIASSDGVAVAVEELELPPNELVHEARNKFESTRKVASSNHANLFCECFK
jgi:hypothetical protein